MDIKNQLKQKFPNLFKKLKNEKDKVRNYHFREHRIYGGKLHAEKTYFIIRCNRPNSGLMSYYTDVLGKIQYALAKGWIPVVDMKNYPNTYLEKKDLRKANSWEYYFEQPSAISLEEVYNGRNVIVSSGVMADTASPRDLYLLLQNNENAEQIYRIARTYMKHNTKTTAHIEQEYANIFPKQGRVLGVVCRGTDLLNFPNHSVQPSIDELIRVVREVMERSGYQYVFIASDEERNIEYFREIFGSDKILSNQCARFDSFSRQKDTFVPLGDMHFQRDNDSYYKGLEYLTTIGLLSRCDGLVGTLVGATVGALVMNAGKYKEVKIIDLGTYPVNK